IWGLPCESLYERPDSIIDSVMPEDRMRWAVALAEQTLHPQTELEYRILRPDGQMRWIRTRLFPIQGAQPDMLRMAGVSEDITDRKCAELEILEISSRERHLMGQEIHDGICQHLIGIAYLTKALERSLSTQDHAHAERAAHIGQLVQES